MYIPLSSRDETNNTHVSSKSSPAAVIGILVGIAILFISPFILKWCVTSVLSLRRDKVDQKRNWVARTIGIPANPVIGLGITMRSFSSSNGRLDNSMTVPTVAHIPAPTIQIQNRLATRSQSAALMSSRINFASPSHITSGHINYDLTSSQNPISTPASRSGEV
jgi:hypothetical protein